MVFPVSKLPKFVLCSLIVHVSVVAVLLNLEYEHDHQIPVEVTFSRGASGDGRPKGEVVAPEKRIAPAAKPQSRPAAQSEVISDGPQTKAPNAVSDNVQGEGGTGINIGTGEKGEGFGSQPGIETAKSKYFSLVAQTIYKNKHYPRQAYSLNQEGNVLVSLKLDKSGKILDVKILEKAPFKSLTNATLETINSINKFPPIPDELGLSEITFRIPIEYKIQM